METGLRSGGRFCRRTCWFMLRLYGNTTLVLSLFSSWTVGVLLGSILGLLFGLFRACIVGEK